MTPVGGAAGQGGEAGAGGEDAGPAALKLCKSSCNITADCAVTGATEQMVCDDATKRCVLPSEVLCTAAADCFPFANSWTPCSTNQPCEDESQACITWQGKGYCAYRSLDGCFLPGEEAVTLPEFGKVDSPVAVCVAPGGCRLGKCEPGCEATGCEGSGNGDTCGSTSHLCECSQGTECTASGVCGADHQCAQCATSEDCPGGASGLDTCVDGRCGCSGAAVCPDDTAAGVPVCE